MPETRNKLIKDSRSYILRARSRLIGIMGGKCAHCGFLDHRALQIDHVNGGGSYEMKNFPYGLARSMYFRIVEKSFLANENHYQILCANCNWIKRVVNREVGGIRRRSLKAKHRHGRVIFAHEKPPSYSLEAVNGSS